MLTDLYAIKLHSLVLVGKTSHLTFHWTDAILQLLPMVTVVDGHASERVRHGIGRAAVVRVAVE